MRPFRYVISVPLSIVVLVCFRGGNLWANAFSARSSFTHESSAASPHKQTSSNNNVLILDHWNINHEKGRQDWLLAFYFDFLQCALDPRKLDNLEHPTRRKQFGLPPLNESSKKRTIWANIGAHQFHLPQGKPQAQVLDGVITLVYQDLQPLLERYSTIAPSLEGSMFQLETAEDNGDMVLKVTDPWGSKFKLVQGSDRDPRGKQPGEESEGLAMRDLTIHTPMEANLAGIGRFYEQVLGAIIVEDCKDVDCIQIQVGPYQTLTFRPHSSTTSTSHVDLRDEEHDDITDGSPFFPSNYGPHISMYVADLSATYQRAAELGVAYVNPRFSRRAYTLDQALQDCMFRCLNIVDPENVQDGPILQLEHEIRSVVKVDGTKYKSCPFDEIPPECKTKSS